METTAADIAFKDFIAQLERLIPDGKKRAALKSRLRAAWAKGGRTLPYQWPFPEPPNPSWPLEGWQELWTLWRNWKRDQFRFTYKKERSEALAVAALGKFSGMDFTIACNIVRQSISQGYAGLFELKRLRNGSEPTQRHGEFREAANGLSERFAGR